MIVNILFWISKFRGRRKLNIRDEARIFKGEASDTGCTSGQKKHNKVHIHIISHTKRKADSKYLLKSKYKFAEFFQIQKKAN